MKLYIKNMVCDRCVMVVENILESLSLNPTTISLGVVGFDYSLSPTQITEFENRIRALGFHLINDKKGRLIQKIKTVIMHLISNQYNLSEIKLSNYLSRELHYDYNYLSNLFSAHEKNTIEQFYIMHKIEKVKELIFYDELSLTQISHQLGYSSQPHLSNQFKSITGIAPNMFKKLNNPKLRNSLDKL